MVHQNKKIKRPLLQSGTIALKQDMKRIYEKEAYSEKVGSYWETTRTPAVWPSLDHDISTHTLVIGAGYTGLNCALELAERNNMGDVVILEAQQPGWGASGRNGGFCCMGGSKLPFAGHLKRFGHEQTLGYYHEQRRSVETVRANLKRYKINADIHSNGETLLAHSPKHIEELHAEARHLEKELGLKPSLVEQNELRQHGLASPQFHGALTNPIGFALNPIKYVSSLAEQINKAAIAAFGNSPALDIAPHEDGWKVQTPTGTVSAKHLVIATNGYSSEDIPGWLKGRLLPTLTNIIVTRPLTPQELASQGWTSHQMCYDTRNSLHYFHLLPQQDGEEGPRMLFGMRAGTSATPTSQARMKTRIRADFDGIFPEWRSVETPFFWSGLVCLTRDLLSFTGPIPGMKNAYASLAYHGNGVAMASHCGRLLAQIIEGELPPEDIPMAMRQTPRTFPFPALRRNYLSLAYKWYEWLDG